MKCALDAQLTLGTATGIGEYVRGLAPALRAQGVEVSELRWPRLDPWRFDRRLIWDQIGVPSAALAVRADLVHCAAGTMPLWAPAPLVVTVHDVAWLRSQQHARAYARWYFGPFALGRYRHAARILVDSRFSKAELIALSGIAADRIDVAYPGVAAEFATLERRPADALIILAVGTVERRKNLVAILRAAAPIANARVISVGPPTPYLAECRKLAADLGIADRVEFRGYVSRADLVHLYAAATVAVAPSTYEGFGYAAAQALCAGVPLIVAGAASLPEVAGNDAITVDPADVASWTGALRWLFAERAQFEQRAHAARAAACERFSWAQTAERIASAYRAALA